MMSFGETGPLAEHPRPTVAEHGTSASHSTEPDLNRDAVRRQLESILSSSTFRNSKRCSRLLRYVVEQTLDGQAAQLKERTIGIDVFDRSDDYDTRIDHIVRSVAGDVRRRLAQYYVEETGTEAEVRIDLPVGLYIPGFRFVAHEQPATAVPETHGPLPIPPAETSPVAKRLRGSSTRRSVLIAAGAIVLIGAVTLILHGMSSPPRTALDRFWSPVLSSGKPVLLCAGNMGANLAPNPEEALGVAEYDLQPGRRMPSFDALALANLAGLFESYRKHYRILNRAGAATFGDLQSGPFVLIGAMNNEWTRPLIRDLRFSFRFQAGRPYIADRQNPSNTAWGYALDTPIQQFSRDYAIVTRVRDPQSEQFAVVVGGICSWGTLAAGELVSKPEQFAKVDGAAPAHWESKNLQVVIATDVIRGVSGPPKVLAVHAW
jgi:hypothetical protein